MPRDFLIKYIESNLGEWMKTGTRAETFTYLGSGIQKEATRMGELNSHWSLGTTVMAKLTKIWKDK